ncbi:MAG: HAD family hydrolase [Chloroflexi bacterium]|nr:HAD family hydrolase [Chloroflexota bacterium]
MVNAWVWVHPRFDAARVRAIFFDLDGTLRDTDDELVHRLARGLSWLAPWTARATRERWARRMVMALESPVNALYAWADRWHLDTLFHRLPWPRKDQVARGRLVPGVRETIPTLAAHYPLALVSAGSEHVARAFLQHTGLAPYFRIVVGGPTYRRTKPHPEPIVRTAQALGLAPAHVLMVGDTTVDIRAAKAAGAQAIGVLSGFGTADELQAAGADALLPSPANLPLLLGLHAAASQGDEPQPHRTSPTTIAQASHPPTEAAQPER